MYQLLFLCAISATGWVEGFPGFQYPYGFGYSVMSPFGGEQHRQESGSGGNVQGSYGYTDSKGLYRQVEYIADQGGFRAKVKTNEPGTASQDPAAVTMMSSGQPYFGPGGASGGFGYGYSGQSYGHGGGSGYNQEWEKAAAGQHEAGYGMSGSGGLGGYGYMKNYRHGF